MLAVLKHTPLIAILRGLQPENAATAGQILYGHGWRVIEVPLNSPDALRSISILRQELPHDCLIGAGTVLDADSVDAVAAVGGQVIVSPHAQTDVIVRSKALGLVSVAGVMTPGEAFAALACGADALKYFPCEALPPAAISAQRAVLPAGTLILAVGGIAVDNMAAYYQAGADGFGFGSALFTARRSNDELADRAQAIQRHWHAIAGRP